MYLFSFRKSFWKTNKNNRRLRTKTDQVFEYFNDLLTIEDLIHKNALNNHEVKKELDKTKEM